MKCELGVKKVKINGFQLSTILVSAKVSAKAFIFGIKPTTPVVSRWTSCGKAGRYFLSLDLQGFNRIFHHRYLNLRSLCCLVFAGIVLLSLL